MTGHRPDALNYSCLVMLDGRRSHAERRAHYAPMARLVFKTGDSTLTGTHEAARMAAYSRGVSDLNHPAPQSSSGGLTRAPILEHPHATGLANTIQGAAIAAGASDSIWLRPGVIPAEIILGNVALQLTLPSLAQISGLDVVPALWLMNATLAVGLVAAFRRPNQGGDRLITALASLIVASLYDSYAMWVASTNATALAIALVFAVPLFALAIGVGSTARSRSSSSAPSLLGASYIPTEKLTVGAERALLQGSDQEGIGNGA